MDNGSLLCNPLESKGEEDLFVMHPESHLKCYDIEDAPGEAPFRGAAMSAEDQFGRYDLRLGRSTRLCEIAAKE